MLQTDNITILTGAKNMQTLAPMPAYRSDDHHVMHCNGCGGQHWFIGRISAECAFCGYAVPFAAINQQAMEPRFTVSFTNTAEAQR